MAKRRLTQGMRETLKYHLSKVIAPAKELAAVEKAYAKAEPLIRAVVEKKFPPADMVVLDKYNQCYPDQCIKIHAENGYITEFRFNDRPSAPLVCRENSCSSRMYGVDEKTGKLVEQWADAVKALKEEHKRRLAAYVSVIHSARTVEDIAEVWPEADKLLPIVNPLPVVMNPEIIALVKSDSKERARAAAKADGLVLASVEAR